MLYVVLVFLVLSFFLYVLLGGADFGAGIIELFSSKDNQKPIKKTVYEVMGPVWEANHIWIIIMIVILWIGFPATYNVVVVYLHIPLTLVLLGITLRGAAFIFRHYDAIKGGSQKLYDRLFRISCLITPIFLGMTFGALVTGDIVLIEDNPNAGFYEVYVHPWLQVFPILIGCFYATLCSFLASVFLIGEASDDEKRMYMRKARVAILAVIAFGFLVLITGFAEGRDFVTDFVANPFADAAVLLSAILLYPLFRAIRFGRVKRCRFFGGLQVSLILFAAAITHFPHVIETTSGKLNFMDGLAPQSVMNVLAISLIIGGLLIIPGFLHLLKSFHMIKMLEDKE
ncbi:cytochrome d ubiquinol oxidase subunit II [Flavobacterium sp. MAH-1]|uniref:Cytochrome d ubiquinol oxidase subunit II n=1 Tax=Flavobacterium agri TaxID=2743471 RepID=A0A7Y8Y3F6_9FLAO|nr:cytochrome d ubiquinol oxidase subunit II [Flavobacterium agri]NUY80556.1 cytochrome d ubiquinol oxidase subunit II [Flavobacterium agri]NYA70580.1 cytochrome d ubiquinol oxidase subunit II [Flavobacterium agri]